MAKNNNNAQRILDDLRELFGNKPKIEIREADHQVHLSSNSLDVSGGQLKSLVKIVGDNALSFRRSGPNFKMIIR